MENVSPNSLQTLSIGRAQTFNGSVGTFLISVALPGVSSQTPHFAETKSGLKS